jgi:hypothetical protein
VGKIADKEINTEGLDNDFAHAPDDAWALRP